VIVSKRCYPIDASSDIYIADDEVAALPYSQYRKSVPGEYIFALSFLIAKKLVPSLAINPHSLGAPRQDMIYVMIIYNVPRCICFTILWSGSRDLDTWVFLLPPFHWLFPVASTFPIRGCKKCSNGAAQDEEEVPVSELPGGVELLLGWAKVLITCRLGMMERWVS
jgi:hypothetical protein